MYTFGKLPNDIINKIQLLYQKPIIEFICYDKYNIYGYKFIFKYLYIEQKLDIIVPIDEYSEGLKTTKSSINKLIALYNAIEHNCKYYYNITSEDGIIDIVVCDDYISITRDNLTTIKLYKFMFKDFLIVLKQYIDIIKSFLIKKK